MKELPLGNQSFAVIRYKDLFYVDKTEYIYNLLKSPENNYFLSRPRRFGKTLLLNTIKELFKGNRKPFEGLWIDSSDYAFPKHPVLYLSLSMQAPTPEILWNSILFKLRKIAKREKLAIEGDTPDLYFGSLIEALYEKAKAEGEAEAEKKAKDKAKAKDETLSEPKPEPYCDEYKVAILIDEYDAPVTRNMKNNAVAKANADILHDFFATLKEDDVASCIRFTFVTGITRYALTSMDSGPNHLND
ncbi:MAG: AAA family ATPase, partial [Deltaproteobacteria bacterium]|nr:AAA family ATPase [Deltaproteobacteria bacterium]